MGFKNILLECCLFFLHFYLISAQDKPCGDHDVKINHFKNCAEPKNSNIKIHNITVAFTEDCTLVPRGCFKIKKTIPAAKVEYYINKPPFKKKGTEDFCKTLEAPDTQKSLESYKNMPRKCSLPAGDYCVTKGSTKVDKINSKTLNLLTGVTTGSFTITSEGSGEKACMEFKVTVTKKG